jgi:type I restriction enzyme S subunit
MSDWVETAVGEVVTRSYSGPSPTCEERNIRSEEEWGLLKTTAITWAGWNEFAHKVPPRLYWHNKAIEVHTGDVLVTKAGPRHRVGVIADVRSTQPRLMASGKMIGLTPNTTRVLPRILAGVLATRGPQEYLNQRTTGMAESQVNFTNETLLGTPIRIPSMREQQLIATILDAVDDVIGATTRLIAKLQLIMQGVLHDLVNVQGERDQPVARLGEVLVAIEAGWTPASEELTPSTGEWGVLKVSAVSGGSYDPAEAKRLAKGVTPRAQLEVKSGDVLLARANGVADLVATVVEVPTTPPRLTISDKTLRLVPQQTRITGSFMTLALQSASSRRQVRGLLNGSSGQQNISQAQIRRIQIALPPLPRQAEIVDATRSLGARLGDERLLLAKLLGIKRGLLDDLLTGRVQIKLAEDAA